MRPYVWVEKEEARVGATDTCAIHSLNLLVPSGPTQAVWHTQLYGVVSQSTPTL